MLIAYAQKAPGIVESLDKIIPGDGFAGIFSFGLQIGLAIAFGTIIFAGFLYMTAGDNPSKVKEAGAWIMAAVEGLIILSGAYILLNTINPQLTTVKEIEIPELELSEYYPKSYSGASLVEPTTEDLNLIKQFLPQINGIIPASTPITSCPQPNRCISGYGCNNHIGIDFGASCGTPVRSAGKSTVFRLEKSASGYGNLVVLSHDNGYLTYYAHLSEINPSVKPGVVINEGQIIGAVGSTGKSTGCHLHFEVRRDGIAYNISPVFKEMNKTADSGCR